jgi:hypothetical protein
MDLAWPLHWTGGMEQNQSTRLIPPALPTRVLLGTLAFALVCFLVPSFVGAAPTAKSKRAAVHSNIAHVDVSSASASGKAIRKARLSLRLTDHGQASELSTTIDGVHYKVRVSAHLEGRDWIAEVHLKAHSRSGPDFELNARSLSTRGKTLLLGEAGIPQGKQTRVSLTLE